MKKIFYILVVLILTISTVNAKLIVVNTNSYKPIKQDISKQRNITKTIIITKTRKLNNYAYDQIWYDFKRNEKFNKKISDVLDKQSNYKDNTATKGDYLSIPRNNYYKYYECYNSDFNHYYNDYDFENQCLN